jgi:ribosome-associated toxin RatA of RatAB toxin-antitoxin module
VAAAAQNRDNRAAPGGCMREVHRNAIVAYSAAQMYAVVNDVARYPEFVPWCPRAQVHEVSASAMVATLEIARGGLTTSIRTCNRLVPDASIELEQVEGPLKAFLGTWTFTPIRRDGLEVGCQVDLHVRFDFKSRALALVFGPLFMASWNSLVDAFVSRADALYGEARAR